MKTKALAFAIAAGAALPVFANIDDVTGVANVNVKNDDYAIEAGAVYKGFTVLGEYVVDTGELKRGKEFTGTIKYRYDINDAFYIEPVASYTRYLKDKNFSETVPGATHNLRNIDTTKVGLKGGWTSDFGLYTAARYRYEIGGSESKELITNKNERRKVHRTDLTVGYNFSKIQAQYNWVHKKATKEQFTYDSGKRSTNAHEVKFTYTDFNSVKPFVELSFEDRKPIGENSAKKKEAVKVGMVFTY